MEDLSYEYADSDTEDQLQTGRFAERDVTYISVNKLKSLRGPTRPNLDIRVVGINFRQDVKKIVFKVYRKFFIKHSTIKKFYKSCLPDSAQLAIPTEEIGTTLESVYRAMFPIHVDKDVDFEEPDQKDLGNKISTQEETLKIEKAIEQQQTEIKNRYIKLCGRCGDVTLTILVILENDTMGRYCFSCISKIFDEMGE